MTASPSENSKTSQKPIFMVSLEILWKLLDRKRRLLAIALIGLMLISSIFEMFGMLMIFAYIGGLAGGGGGPVGALIHLYERVFGTPTQIEFALWGGMLVIALFLFKNALTTAVDFLLTRFLMKRYELVVRHLQDGMLRMRYELIKSRGIGEVQRIINRSMTMFHQAFGAALQILSDAILISIVVCLLMFVDPGLTIGATALFGFFGVVTYGTMRKQLFEMGEKEKEAARAASIALNESFHGLIDARLGHKRKYFVDKFSIYAKRGAIINRRRQILTRLPRVINEVLLASGIVAAVLYFAWFGKGINDALPILALFGFAGLRLTGALSRLSGNFQAIRQRESDIIDLLEAINEVAPGLIGKSNKSKLDYSRDNLPLPEGANGHLEKKITIKGLTFAYPGSETDVINGIDLEIPRGSFIGLCGGSGGGKSTLALLLMGLMEPKSGKICCDEWNIQDHILTWHRNIGFVDQKPFLTQNTIRENVAFGYWPDEIDDDKVWHALKLARMDDYVQALPNGLYSFPGEDGDFLSGGQRQRIAIARALYDEPDILFFDEATAALDNVTEKEIVSAIKHLAGDKTIICIAHRLSTIEQADRIYMLENGLIAAEGTYKDLLEKSEDFRRLTLAD